VLHDLDLDVAEGEFLVLLGASGSGKTTALRMVAGLETVSSGVITIAGRDAAIRDVAAQVQLGALLDRYPRQLSGGQRQRVALARAMVRRPKVFLMDEPLSNLDAKLRGHMRAELKHMQHSLGITTIYVTHDQIEAMTLAHRVALLDNGRLHQL